MEAVAPHPATQRAKPPRTLLPNWQEAVFLGLCASVLLWQLFLPGFIGSANNGDFPKVIGPLCIGGADNYADNFIFFEAEYLRDPKFCYTPGIPASEILLARAATSLQGAIHGGRQFDIRWMAALHSLLFLGFYFAVLVLLRPLSAIPRVLLSLAAIWIFADVSYASYFNSFFPDTAGILGGLLAAIVAMHLLSAPRIPLGGLILFGLAALLFVTSKAPHAIAGIVPLGFLLAIAFRASGTRVRIVAGLFAAALTVGAVWLLKTTPGWYQGQARYNLIFSKIVSDSATPARDLVELGLDESEMRLAGTNAFMANSPMSDPKWADEFCRRSTLGKLLRFYSKHPSRIGAFLWYDLVTSARQRRPANLSNFRREDGHPAGALTRRMGTWSALRSWLFIKWPAHMIVWYALMLVGVPFLLLRERLTRGRAVLWTMLAVSAMGAGEFLIASLADACETYRHLILFHVFTDAAIFFALVYAATRFDRVRAVSPPPS